MERETKLSPEMKEVLDKFVDAIVDAFGFGEVLDAIADSLRKDAVDLKNISEDTSQTELDTQKAARLADNRDGLADELTRVVGTWL